nr:reverse transcriptase [Tanacetum cinerariifolium]
MSRMKKGVVSSYESLLSINWYQSCLPGNSDGVSDDQNNNLITNTPTLTDPIQVALAAIQENLTNIQDEVRTHTDCYSEEGIRNQSTKDCETYGLARMQEATNTILKPRYNTPLLPTPKQSTTTYVSKAMTTPVKSNLVGQSSGYVTTNGAHKPYRLTQRELKDKRAKGQCFYCDQKCAPGHKCSGQLHYIEVICGDDFDNYIDDDDETYQDCVVQLCQMESVGSVYAEVDQVLTQFDEVFKVPKDLPP